MAMHVSMVGIYDVSTMAGGYSFEKMRQHIADRLHLVPPFHRRLVEVPFQFHHPVWVEDPDFNLDYHVRRIGCPAPGGRRELAEVAAQIASVPLDRTRPLWEAWVIEGLKNDRVGFVVKVHHSAIDGASGAEIMTRCTTSSRRRPGSSRSPPSPSTSRTTSSCVTYAALSKLRRTSDVFGLLGRTFQIDPGAGHPQRPGPQDRHGAVPLTAPRTPFNHSIGPNRTVAFARVPSTRPRPSRRPSASRSTTSSWRCARERCGTTSPNTAASPTSR